MRIELNQDHDSEIEAVIYDGDKPLVELALARNADRNGYQGWLDIVNEESRIHWRELPNSLDRVA